MPITAQVARTAGDLKHANRLRVAPFGVLKLCLKTKKASKCYVPEGAPEPKQESGASDDFNFAPIKEKVNVVFKLQDPAGAITKAKLELFRRGREAASWTLKLEEKDLKLLEDGEHSFEWDGKIPKNAEATEFPEDCVTVQHSPYKLKLTVEGDGFGFPLCAWTYFHVLVHEIWMYLGDEKAVKLGADARKKKWFQRAYASVKDNGFPAKPSDKVTVYLASDIYARPGELLGNQDFTNYKTEWGEGPQIPVFAKCKIRTSSGGKEEVHEALGKVRFLWEWEDVAEVPADAGAKAKDFVAAAVECYKDKTLPKGDNCWVKRGGKRGWDVNPTENAASPVFTTQAGYAPQDTLKDEEFPFKVWQCTKRKASAYSESWPSKKLKGETGVMFQPSRMAGDAYKLSVYLAHDRKADGTDELDKLDTKDVKPLNYAVKGSSGTFQVKRELHFTKYIKKRTGIANFAAATVQGFYRNAMIEFLTSGMTSTTFVEAAYNDAIENYRAAGNIYVQLAIPPKADLNQYTSGDAGVYFRNYATFKAKVIAHYGWTAADWTTNTNPGGVLQDFATAQSYADWLQSRAQGALRAVCDAQLDPKDGVTIFHFIGPYNLENLASSVLGGYAEYFPSADRYHCGFLGCGGRYYALTADTLEQTITHEVGHHLFLPHAVDSVPPADPFINAAAHDDSYHNCMMSYNHNPPKTFCGLCILRLRGWDRTQLNKTKASNKLT
jgi:hypothetical protein